MAIDFSSKWFMMHFNILVKYKALKMDILAVEVIIFSVTTS